MNFIDPSGMDFLSSLGGSLRRARRRAYIAQFDIRHPKAKAIASMGGDDGTALCGSEERMPGWMYPGDSINNPSSSTGIGGYILNVVRGDPRIAAFAAIHLALKLLANTPPSPPCPSISAAPAPRTEYTPPKLQLGVDLFHVPYPMPGPYKPNSWYTEMLVESFFLLPSWIRLGEGIGEGDTEKICQNAGNIMFAIMLSEVMACAPKSTLMRIPSQKRYFKIVKKGAAWEMQHWPLAGSCAHPSMDSLATRFLKTLGDYNCGKIVGVELSFKKVDGLLVPHYFIEYIDDWGRIMRYDPSLSDNIGWAYGKTCVPNNLKHFTLQEHEAILKHIKKRWKLAPRPNHFPDAIW